MPQPHSLGAFGQDGQRELIQSESCQGGADQAKKPSLTGGFKGVHV